MENKDITGMFHPPMNYQRADREHFGRGVDFNGSNHSLVDLAEQSSKEVSIETKEGDLVTIADASYFEGSVSSYNSFGRSGGESSFFSYESFAFQTGREFTLSVEGDLNKNEISDIKNIMKDMEGIMAELRSGDMQEAVDMALGMLNHRDTLQSIEAELSYESRFSMETGSFASLPGRPGRFPGEENPELEGERNETPENTVLEGPANGAPQTVVPNPETPVYEATNPQQLAPGSDIQEVVPNPEIPVPEATNPRLFVPDVETPDFEELDGKRLEMLRMEFEMLRFRGLDFNVLNLAKVEAEEEDSLEKPEETPRAEPEAGEPVAVSPEDDEPVEVKPDGDEPVAVNPEDDEPVAVEVKPEEPPVVGAGDEIVEAAPEEVALGVQNLGYERLDVERSESEGIEVDRLNYEKLEAEKIEGDGFKAETLQYENLTYERTVVEEAPPEENDRGSELIDRIRERVDDIFGRYDVERSKVAQPMGQFLDMLGRGGNGTGSAETQISKLFSRIMF